MIAKSRQRQLADGSGSAYKESNLGMIAKSRQRQLVDGSGSAYRESALGMIAKSRQRQLADGSGSAYKESALGGDRQIPPTAVGGWFQILPLVRITQVGSETIHPLPWVGF